MGLERGTVELNDEFDGLAVDIGQGLRQLPFPRAARSWSPALTGAERLRWRAC